MICFVVTLPGPPTNVELTKVTQTTATLQWTAPKNGTVKQYIIAYLEHDREGSSPNMVRQIQIPQMIIPIISTKWTITSFLNSLNTKKGGTTTYDVVNPDHGMEHA
jgi:hypothetical protein